MAERGGPRGAAVAGRFLYFAGRTDDRLRVDSENLAAAVIENILARYEDAAAVAVYAVPDAVAGTRSWLPWRCAPRPPSIRSPSVSSCCPSPTWGPRWPPRFVRIVPRMPVTATNKVHRVGLRREGFRCPDPVWWRPPGECAYRRLTGEEVGDLVAEYRARGREELLTR